jgi:hypothetical protein
MKQLIKNQKFSVFDDLFSESNINHINLYLQHAFWEHPYSPDGVHGTSKEFRHDIVYNNCVDLIFTYAKKLAEVDFCSGWKDCTLTHCFYPRGSKSSWQSNKNFKAIMYFFVHPNWRFNWGGELLVGQTPPNPDHEEKAYCDNKWHNDHLNHFGTGIYVTPKSNRCVVVPGEEWHKISEISDDAGENRLLFFKVLFY